MNYRYGYGYALLYLKAQVQEVYINELSLRLWLCIHIYLKAQVQEVHV